MSFGKDLSLRVKSHTSRGDRVPDARAFISGQVFAACRLRHTLALKVHQNSSDRKWPNL